MADGDCRSCGAANRPGAKFCAECGTALIASCPACGAAAPSGRFCSECGSPLTPQAAAAPTPGSPAATAPVSERRVVSMLFGDLVGFTPLSESRDPEAVRELLSAYFDRARAVVERYGGTVEKFIGDAVFAVWGVPIAREDDAELAVRAGLDLVSAVAALGQEVGAEGLQMRVGITTGQVAVTLGAVGEGMVAGDAVNTASRVQAVASPGEVWVDDPTRSLTTAALAYESAGQHELKGKTLPLELFRAIRTTGVIGGEQRVDGLEAPFVGRDRELRMVKELFHATAEDKRARLVLVAGDPGIGKSRLAWEFEKYLDAIKSHWAFWLRGRCLSYGQGVAGRVVAEMVRSLLRVTDNDDEETVRAALNGRLDQHVKDESVRDVLRPRLESLLGLSDRAFEQADMFASWRGFFEELTRDDDGSVVTLVVEDLQWADDAFLDFVDYLLESAQAPIMVLAMARPEVTTRRAGIGVGRRSTTVFLDPLSPTSMRQLLDGLVGNLPASLRDELVRRADGIPLYAVETVRSLIDRDVVVPAGGRYVVDDTAVGSFDLADLSPPASLHALLAARLDALTPDERRVVQDGSVLGLTFTRAGLEALTTTTADLDEVLGSLRRKEILNVDTDPRSPERGQFRFVQALLRGVAYDTLSRRDRKSRHIAVAEHLAGNVEGEAIAGVLAQHYLDAAAAVPEDDDVADLNARAAAMLERAAEHATDVGAPADALNHYGQMMALDLPDNVVIRVATAAYPLARRAGTQITQVLEWVERALTLAEHHGTEDQQLALILGRSQLRYATADFEGARADAEFVLDAAAGAPHRVQLLSAAARQVSVGAQISGNFALAQRAATLALADIERFGDDNDFAMLLDSMAMWFGLAGYRRLTALVRRAAADRYRARHPDVISLYANLAAGLVHENPHEAAEAALHAIETAGEFGMTQVVGLGHLVASHLSVGNWSEADRRLREHAETDQSDLIDWETYLLADSALLAWERGDPSALLPPSDAGKDSEDAVVAAWWLMHNAVRIAYDGNLAAGAQDAARAVELACTIGVANEDVPLVYSLAVDMLLEAGDLPTLERITVPIAELPIGPRFRLLHAQLLRVEALLSDSPVDGLRQAVDVLDGMGAAFWAARVRVDLASALAAAGDAAAANATLSAAEPLLREIGAGRALRQIDDLRTGADLTPPAMPRQAEAEPATTQG